MNDLIIRVKDRISFFEEWTGRSPKNLFVSISDWDKYVNENGYKCVTKEYSPNPNSICGLSVFRVIEEGVLEMI